MDEFLRLNYFTINSAVEIIAAVTGLICFKKYRKTAVTYFIVFLVYAALVDYLGSYPVIFKRINLYHLIQGTVFEKNYLYYTLLWGIGTALFFMFFYGKILNHPGRKRFLRVAALLFFMGALVDLFLNVDTLGANNRIGVFVAGSFLVLLCVCFYFIEVLESDKVLTFYKSIYFWISSVILLWYLITTPLLFYEIYFSTADWNFVILKWQIYLAANVCMYLSFTIALLWCKPQNN
ncbi:hypothetical protein MWU76_14920 [Gelidibacter sp. F2691]|nr:hypothetical protein [Gelidibacter sp. F2691]